MEMSFPYDALIEDMQNEIRLRCDYVSRFFLSMTCRRARKREFWENTQYDCLVMNECIVMGWTACLRGFFNARGPRIKEEMILAKLRVPFIQGDLPMIEFLYGHFLYLPWGGKCTLSTADDDGLRTAAGVGQMDIVHYLYNWYLSGLPLKPRTGSLAEQQWGWFRKDVLLGAFHGCQQHIMVWLFATFPEHHHSMVLNAYNECLFSPSSIRLEELDTLVSALGVDTVFSSACGDMWQRLYPSMARFDAFLTEPLGQWLMKHNIQPLPGLRIFRGRDQRVIMNGIDDTYADILARGPQSGYYVRNHSQEPKPKEDF